MTKYHQKIYLEVINQVAEMAEGFDRKRSRYICNKVGGHKLVPHFVEMAEKTNTIIGASDIAEYVFLLYISKRTYKDVFKETRLRYKEYKTKNTLMNII